LDFSLLHVFYKHKNTCSKLEVNEQYPSESKNLETDSEVDSLFWLFRRPFLSLKKNFILSTKMATPANPIISPEIREQDLVLLDPPRKIVVFNDDVNTFDWVIESLMEVCAHTHDQAEQCAWIIHYKGKYAVKHGSFEELEPMASELGNRGLTVEIQ
jgi:ATP-dependent Clp protease adaptor protein ClpS